MNTLLTGSNGFIGEILKKNIESSAIRTLSRKNADYNFDLSRSVPTFNEEFDLVIHLAGKAHSTTNSIQDKKAFFNTNVQGTLNLLKGLDKSYVPKSFVLISSVSVYGLLEGELVNEDIPLLAQDPYGKSKIEAEIIVQDWCKNNNVVCTIFRLPLVVGANPPGNLGAMIEAIQNGYYFNIAGGKAKKSMVLASDIACFIIKAAKIGGIYNLTDGVHPSFGELSNNISRQLGKSKLYSIPQFLANFLAKIGDLAGERFPLNTRKFVKITSTLTFDDSRARSTFGWNPKPVLEEVFIK